MFVCSKTGVCSTKVSFSIRLEAAVRSPIVVLHQSTARATESRRLRILSICSRGTLMSLTNRLRAAASNRVHLISRADPPSRSILTAHLRTHLHVNMSLAWKFVIVSETDTKFAILIQN